MTKFFFIIQDEKLEKTSKATVPLSEFCLAPEPKVMKGLGNRVQRI
jgi:hypothetical protein